MNIRLTSMLDYASGIYDCQRSAYKQTCSKENAKNPCFTFSFEMSGLLGQQIDCLLKCDLSLCLSFF